MSSTQSWLSWPLIYFSLTLLQLLISSSVFQSEWPIIVFSVLVSVLPRPCINDIIIQKWQCHWYYLSSHTKIPLCSCFGLFKIKKFLFLEFLNSFKLLPFYVLILTEPYFLAFLYELHLRSLQRKTIPNKTGEWFGERQTYIGLVLITVNTRFFS